RRDQGLGLSPLLCAEHLQRRADARVGLPHHALRAVDLRAVGTAREAADAVERVIFFRVIAGLVPAIYVFVDARNKSGHNDRESVRPLTPLRSDWGWSRYRRASSSQGAAAFRRARLVRRAHSRD